MGKSKNSDASFIMQGSILAIASIISRIVGLIYRIPLTAIVGKTGNDYYGTAYSIYNIILIMSSFSLPLAVSKLVASEWEMAEQKMLSGYLRERLDLLSLVAGLVLCSCILVPITLPGHC